MSQYIPPGLNRSTRRQLERSETKNQRREEKKQLKNAVNGAKYNPKKCRKVVPQNTASLSRSVLHIPDDLSEDIEVIGEIEFVPQTITITKDIEVESMALDFEKMQVKDKTELAPCLDNLSEITSESSVTADDCLTALDDDDEINSISNQDQTEEASFTSTLSDKNIPYSSDSMEKKKSKTSLLKLFNHKNLSKLSIKSMIPPASEDQKKTTEKKTKKWKKFLKKTLK